jgi:hypothetical protein
MFNHILLGVDGSEHALHAAKTAADLARNIKSSILRIVVAYDPVPSYLGEPNMQTAISARMKEARRNPYRNPGRPPCGGYYRCRQNAQERSDRDGLTRFGTTEWCLDRQSKPKGSATRALPGFDRSIAG